AATTTNSAEILSPAAITPVHLLFSCIKEFTAQPVRISTPRRRTAPSTASVSERGLTVASLGRNAAARAFRPRDGSRRRAASTESDSIGSSSRRYSEKIGRAHV